MHRFVEVRRPNLRATLNPTTDGELVMWVVRMPFAGDLAQLFHSKLPGRQKSLVVCATRLRSENRHEADHVHVIL